MLHKPHDYGKIFTPAKRRQPKSGASSSRPIGTNLVNSTMDGLRGAAVPIADYAVLSGTPSVFAVA